MAIQVGGQPNLIHLCEGLLKKNDTISFIGSANIFIVIMLGKSEKMYWSFQKWR